MPEARRSAQLVLGGGGAAEPAGTAVFGGPHDAYRYRLERCWHPELPKVLFLMLNPSIGTETQDDPIAAWGVHGALLNRGAHVVRLLAETGRPAHALGLTKHGHPHHPLYVRADAEPLPYLPGGRA